MLTWMGFLGQELPGSIIGAECTCSHMPVAERSRAYLRPHAFPHPPPGTRGLWAAAHRGSLPLAAQNWGARGCRRAQDPPHPVCAAPAAGSGCSLCVPALPAAPRVALGSCPQAGDAERSSSHSEMGSAWPQPYLLSPEHVPVAQLEMCGFFQSSDPFAALALTFCQVFFQTSSAAPEEQGSLGEPLLPGPSTSSAGQPHFPRLLLPAGSFPHSFLKLFSLMP